MSDLILQPTNTAHWYSVVYAAQERRAINLDEALESYLIFLLMRFMRKPSLLHSVLAIDFLEAANTQGREQQVLMQELGDKCLLLCGLFPGRAERKRVRVSYFVDIGRSAYSELAARSEEYTDLAQGFVTMMQILHALRPEADFKNLLSPMQANELVSDLMSLEDVSASNLHSDGFTLPEQQGAVKRSH